MRCEKQRWAAPSSGSGSLNSNSGEGGPEVEVCCIWVDLWRLREVGDGRRRRGRQAKRLTPAPGLRTRRQLGRRQLRRRKVHKTRRMRNRQKRQANPPHTTPIPYHRWMKSRRTHPQETSHDQRNQLHERSSRYCERQTEHLVQLTTMYFLVRRTSRRPRWPGSACVIMHHERTRRSRSTIAGRTTPTSPQICRHSGELPDDPWQATPSIAMKFLQVVPAPSVRRGRAASSNQGNGLE